VRKIRFCQESSSWRYIPKERFSQYSSKPVRVPPDDTVSSTSRGNWSPRARLVSFTRR
jgi:hypothetical protein